MPAVKDVPGIRLAMSTFEFLSVSLRHVGRQSTLPPFWPVDRSDETMAAAARNANGREKRTIKFLFLRKEEAPLPPIGTALPKGFFLPVICVYSLSIFFRLLPLFISSASSSSSNRIGNGKKKNNEIRTVLNSGGK